VFMGLWYLTKLYAVCTQRKVIPDVCIKARGTLKFLLLHAFWLLLCMS
jgi:hypothetical protein